MSRTYRLRKTKNTRFEFKTKEEFEEGKICYEEGWERFVDVLKEAGSVYRKANSEYQTKSWFVFEERREKNKELKELKQKVQEAEANYSRIIKSEEYQKYRNAVNFKFGYPWAKTFEETRKLDDVNFHRDGSMWCEGVPGRFVNLNFERPMRRKVKQLIHRCLELDSFDDTLFPEQINGAAWEYW